MTVHTGDHGIKAKSNWKAMVNDKNLTGIQLFAPNGWQTEFIRAYKIKWYTQIYFTRSRW